MSDFNKALEHLTDNIKRYRETPEDDGNALTILLQQITATLFYLEKERAKYHELFQKAVHQLVLSGEAVNRAENKAHVIHPEMYMLRRVMDSAYTVVDAIRTQISWIKTGLHQA